MGCHTDLVVIMCVLALYRRPAKHGNMTRVATRSVQVAQYDTILKPSSGELLREAYELLRYDTILKPSSVSLLQYFYEVH